MTIASINSTPPYSQSSGKDTLDIALIFASYEQDVSLFFHGDGVYQLMANQDGTLISAKDYLKTFSAFEFYDIEKVYVCQKSLEHRNLTSDFHIENVIALSPEEFAKQLTTHKNILRF